MTSTTYTTAEEARTDAPERVLEIGRDTLSGLITCPVAPEKGRHLLAAYRDLAENTVDQDGILTTTDADTAARNLRYASFILDNLSFKDADSCSADRKTYSAWFYTTRKRLSSALVAEAERLNPPQRHD